MKNIVVSALLAFCCPCLAAAAPPPDWALQALGPVEGSEAVHAEAADFGRYRFAAGPEVKDAIGKVTPVEGKVSTALYKAPGKTSFAVSSVYRKYFKENGYELLYSCEAKACGGRFKDAWYALNPFQDDYGWNNSAPLTKGGPDSQFYLAARKKSAAGDIYASVYTNSGWWSYPVYRVDVARPAPLGSGIVPAARIGEVMKADGRLAFYGILFDSGLSVIKAESGPVLEQLAAYLKGAAGETFYVVGHTDDEGGLEANMKLSGERAEAVLKDLAGRGVAAQMLSAHGAGPLAPVASNYPAEGRALNRRVELVRRLPAGARPPAAAAQQQAAQAAQQQAQAAQQQAAQAVQAAQQQAAEAAAAAKEAPKPQEALVPVPKVTGLLLTPGMNILVSQGFKINRLGKTAGIIQQQDPAPNARVKPGSTITITVGK